MGTEFVFTFFNFIYLFFDTVRGQQVLEMRKVMSSGLIQGRNNKEVFCWDLVFSLACQQPAGHSFEESFQIILKFHTPMETRRREKP